MAGITLAQAEAKLTLWMDAEDRVASGQSYTINGRSLTRANLKEIRETITYWNSMVQRLTRGGVRVGGITPVR